MKDDVDELEDREEDSEKTDPASEPLLAEESDSWERCWVRGSVCGSTIGEIGDGN